MDRSIVPLCRWNRHPGECGSTTSAGALHCFGVPETGIEGAEAMNYLHPDRRSELGTLAEGA
jgi:hypothetical protein